MRKIKVDLLLKTNPQKEFTYSTTFINSHFFQYCYIMKPTVHTLIFFLLVLVYKSYCNGSRYKESKYNPKQTHCILTAPEDAVVEEGELRVTLEVVCCNTVLTTV